MGINWLCSFAKKSKKCQATNNEDKPFIPIQFNFLFLKSFYFPCRARSDMSVLVLHYNIHQLDSNRYNNATSPSQFLNSCINPFKVSSNTFVSIPLNFWRLSDTGDFSLDFKKVKNSFSKSNFHPLNSKRDTLRFKFSLYYICKINLWWASGGL